MADVFMIVVALISIALLGVLIVAALKPNTFQVERSMTIDAPSDRVFALINNLKAMNSWNPFAEGHPPSSIVYSGPQSGTGAAYDWDIAGRAGKGRVEITGCSPATSVDMNLVMVRPMAARNKVRFSLRPAGQSTIVTWAMTGPWPYLHRVMGTLFNMDKMLGGQFEKGLRQLKSIAERN